MAAPLLFIPGPVTCSPAVLEAMAKPMIDHRGPAFARLLERVSAGMQPIFGTTADVVVLGASGTGGLEAAVASAFSPGDRVLACPVGVFGKRLATIARTYGLDVEVLETPLGAAVDPAALRERLARPDGGFAGVMLTHNETSTGVQNDMAALAEVLRGYGATVVVDSVSGLGASAFEMDAWGFDIVVTASQKALAVPPGAAMVAVSARAWERIARATGPRFYFDLGKAREFAALGQTPWTPPVSILYALEAAIDAYHAAGAAAAYDRHARYAQAVRSFAEAAGLEVFSHPGAHSVTVVALKAPAGLDVAGLRRTLLERDGLTFGGGQAELKGKIVRVGTMGDIAPAQLLGALRALGAEIAARGTALDVERGIAAAEAILEPVHA